MAELVVKKLQFPDSPDQYLVNAHALEGKRLAEITALIDAVDEKVDTIAGFDALRYMGTIAASSTAPGGLTKAANKGDVYKVVFPSDADEGTKDYYVMGVKVEAGDMLICSADNTAAATSSNYASIATKWDIIQGNVDVEAILKHIHTGNVTFTKSAKTLSHTVTATPQTLTTSFSNGAASVKGDHGHTASGSVTLTPGGSVGNTSITPAGTVKLTSPSTKGTNDVALTPSGTTDDASTLFVTSVTVGGDHVHNHTGTTNASGPHDVTGTVTISTGTGATNYTPAGAIANASKKVVTEVEGGNTTVSAHKASSESAGGHTPQGTITIQPITPAGTISAHTHSVALDVEKDAHNAVGSLTSDYKGPNGESGYTGMDGVLRLIATSSNVTYVKEVSVSSVSEETPTFTGAPVTPNGEFKGTPVAGHTHTINVEDHDAFVPVINVTKEDHNHTFTGTGVQLKATHDLEAASHTHTFTTNNNTGFEHTVTAPTSNHNHKFTAGTINVHADFTGTAASHNHTFTGTEDTHNVSVTVNDFKGNFSGTATGTVTPSVNKVLTDKSDFTIADHSISTVDSGSVTTGYGIQQ